jgi:hypothetical protein
LCILININKKEAMMRRRIPIFIIMVIGMWLCTASVYAGTEVKHSGFLGDYSQLKPGPEGGMNELYIKEGVDFSKYTKLMLDQIIFYGQGGIDPEVVKELADKFDRAVIDALGTAYPLVTEPGPDVVRVRVAITNVQFPHVAMNVVSGLSPAGIGLNVIKKGVTGKSIGVGEISMEFEMLDSQTEDRLAAGVYRKVGVRLRA